MFVSCLKPQVHRTRCILRGLNGPRVGVVWVARRRSDPTPTRTPSSVVNLDPYTPKDTGFKHPSTRDDDPGVCVGRPFSLQIGSSLYSCKTKRKYGCRTRLEDETTFTLFEPYLTRFRRGQQ